MQRHGSMERLRFLQQAHREALITTGEYQLHKQRALHTCSARHPAAVSSEMKGDTQGLALSAYKASRKTTKLATPPVKAVVNGENIQSLMDALTRVAALLEAQLALGARAGAIAAPGPARPASDETVSTMMVNGAPSVASGQYERAVDSGGSKEAEHQFIGDTTMMETAPTEKKKRAGRFAFDRQGRGALTVDDSPAMPPMDPLQLDVRHLMRDEEDDPAEEEARAALQQCFPDAEVPREQGELPIFADSERRQDTLLGPAQPVRRAAARPTPWRYDYDEEPSNRRTNPPGHRAAKPGCKPAKPAYAAPPWRHGDIAPSRVPTAQQPVKTKLNALRCVQQMPSAARVAAAQGARRNK